MFNRPDTSMLWFRMAVPKEHRAAAGKSIVQQSLGTSDRREATLRAGKLRSELFDLWRGAAVVPTFSEIEEAAVVVGYDWNLQEMEEGRTNMRGASSALWKAHSAYENARLEQHAQAAATGDTDGVSDLADQMLQR